MLRAGGAAKGSACEKDAPNGIGSTSVYKFIHKKLIGKLSVYYNNKLEYFWQIKKSSQVEKEQTQFF